MLAQIAGNLRPVVRAVVENVQQNIFQQSGKRFALRIFIGNYRL